MAGKHPIHQAQIVQSAELSNKVLELTKRHLSQREIAKELGISATWVNELFKRAIADITVENATTIVALELAKLDALEGHFAPLALAEPESGLTNGGAPWSNAADKVAAAGVILKCADRRAKLLGIDAPEKHEVSGTIGRATPAQARAMMQEAFGSVTPPATPEPLPEGAALASEEPARD